MSPKSDSLTVAAIAIAAMCIVTMDHEAIGHGTACLSQGGHINLVTSVYFRCSVQNGTVAAGGPIGDLTGAAIAWLLLQVTPATRPRLRLLLLLITAFGVFWEAGYALEAMVTAYGDSYFAFRGLFGAPETWWRIGGFVLGIALYLLGIRITLRSARGLAPDVLRTAWIAATIATALAALAYAPAPFVAMRQAVLEIGAGSIPLLFIGRRLAPAQSATEWQIARSVGWIAAAAILYIVFIATLGRGIT
ncbi:MAG TPA: hypothetical protein VGM17_05445 [Rhizomicrobium sp.]